MVTESLTHLSAVVLGTWMHKATDVQASPIYSSWLEALGSGWHTRRLPNATILTS